MEDILNLNKSDFDSAFIKNTIEFIENYLDFHDNVDKNLLELKKLFTLFKKINYKFDSEELLELIDSSPLLEELLINVNSNYLDLKKANKIDSVLEQLLAIYHLKDNKFNQENADDNLKIYLSDIKRMPLLTIEEEHELFKRIANNDLEARKIVIERNLKLVVKIARKYAGYGFELEELIQEGNLGLIRAVEKYDYQKSIHFSFYAHRWIEVYIEKKINKLTSIVTIPENIVSSLPKFKKCVEDLKKSLNRMPTIEEISSSFHVSKLSVKKYFFAIQVRGSVSLDEPLTSYSDTDFKDYLVDDSLSVEQVYEQKRLYEDLDYILRRCNFKERTLNILRLRYGLNGNEPKSYEQIARIFNISRQRVVQIEKEALKKIRRRKESLALIQYLDNAKDLTLKLK